jgi:hypothetical protein
MRVGVCDALPTSQGYGGQATRDCWDAEKRMRISELNCGKVCVGRLDEIKFIRAERAGQ